MISSLHLFWMMTWRNNPLWVPSHLSQLRPVKFLNKFSCQGLAHYLEHMLFMGSEKYPGRAPSCAVFVHMVWMLEFAKRARKQQQQFLTALWQVKTRWRPSSRSMEGPAMRLRIVPLLQCWCESCQLPDCECDCSWCQSFLTVLQESWL